MPQKCKGIFIAGTDTGVGKTFIACLLARFLSQQGAAVKPRKPVETGVEPGVESGMSSGNTARRLSDAQLLCSAVEGRTEIDEICTFALPLPLSPRQAARLLGRELRIAQLVQACTVKPAEFAIVEGAGGLLSPIAEDGNCADLITALGMPAVLVADNRVGCINHTALSIEALQARAIPLLAIVLNQCRQGLYDSTEEIQELTNYPVIAVRHQRHAFNTAGDLRLSAQSIQKILQPLSNVLQ